MSNEEEISACWGKRKLLTCSIQLPPRTTGRYFDATLRVGMHAEFALYFKSNKVKLSEGNNHIIQKTCCLNIYDTVTPEKIKSK